MTVSLYQVSIPLFLNNLVAHSEVFEKAEKYCNENNIDPLEFLSKRLAPDMYTLIQQVQRATFHASQTGAKLAEAAMFEFTDDEVAFSDLQERIKNTIAFLRGLDPEKFINGESRQVQIQTRIGTLNFTGLEFLINFALPQFLFHSTTAYNIIRNAGVEIGKRDFIGRDVYVNSLRGPGGE